MNQSSTYLLAIAFILLHVFVAPAQDMDRGFEMLNRGEFDKASSFFKNILNEHPTNKTALICYGRAIGLAGEPNAALTIFNQLLETYSEDQEVLLNKAEAHLWLKDPAQAIATYTLVLDQDSLSFSALLGTANSLSMSKRYKEANETVGKALLVQPENEQAHISRKFIRLAYANQLASEQQQFDEALALVNANLKTNPTDQESLQLKANISIMSGDYETASDTYKQINNEIDQVLGSSTAMHLLKNDEEALKLAKKALTIADDKNIERANTHYVSALLWSNNLRQARNTSDSLVLADPNSAAYLATQAEVAMYEADFINGYETYNQYLTKDPDSFKGNLGIADASHALGMDDQAYKYAKNTLKYYPGQQDAKNFIQKLHNQHSPTLTGEVSYGRSSDGSSFSGWSLGAVSSLSPRISISANYGERNLHTALERSASQTATLTLGANAQLSKRTKLSMTMSKLKIGLAEAAATDRTTAEVLVSQKVSKSQTLTVGYKSEMQDFNADLLSQNLKTNHLVVKNAMSWKVKGLGWYSEYYHSFFSDGNRRHLLFTSLYKTNDKKGIKGGVNYLTMAFSESKPMNYFSPTSFHQAEVFGDATLKKQTLPVSLNINAALGGQFMNGETQFSWRAKATVEKSAGRLKVNAYGAYSSIVATQINGFSFFNCGLSIKWQLMKTPIFNIN